MSVKESAKGEVRQLLEYAKLLANRGYISNQLGNIAVRTELSSCSENVVITKQRGLSLEEAKLDHIVGIGLESDKLHFGDLHPSIGHALNKQILLNREDVNAVIHVHPDELIAYFSLFYEEEFGYVSADAAIILGAPIVILPPELNVEVDADLAKRYIKNTNVLVLANHGVTTLGATLSQAYHRLNTIVAEVRRVYMTRQLAYVSNNVVPYLSDEEVSNLYVLSEKIL